MVIKKKVKNFPGKIPAGPFDDKGFALLNKCDDGEFEFATSIGGSCKAYLWDYVFYIFNNLKNNMSYLDKLKDFLIQDSLYLYFGGKINAVEDIQKRLAPLETALKFKKIKIYEVENYNGHIFEVSVRWLSHVILFSLVLSAIRNYNMADKNAYTWALENVDTLQKWYKNNCKGKDVKAGWVLKEGDYATHGLGINHAVRLKLI